jgi:hypothetical protein
MTNLYVLPQKSRFPLGEFYVTTAADKTIDPADIASALNRHAQGDWGDVCEDDRRENELALVKHYRLFSVYHDRNGITFWIITECDRSATTALLPDDY